MRLQRFNGDEVFAIDSATVDYYTDEDGRLATTFRADSASVPIQTLPDTEELHAQPFAEFTLYLPKHPGAALLTGRTYSLARGYDDVSGEALTNFYYCEHETVDDIEITVVKRQLNRAQLRISGTTIDVNHYDGSKAPTKVLIEAEFSLAFVDR